MLDTETMSMEEICNRLWALENKIVEKEAEIDKLKQKVAALENSDRQQSLSELKNQIENIERKINEIELNNDPEISFDLREPPTKGKKNILLIGDSIVNHIDIKKITDDESSIDLHCIPGARCDQIYDRLSELTKITDYAKIVCHVGTNYVPQHGPEFVSNKILDFLHKIQMQAPNSKICWSPILPKIDDSFNPGINTINYNIFTRNRHGIRMYTCLNHWDYFKVNGSVDPSFFCWDSVHLSFKGVEALEKSLKCHLINIR